MSKRKRSDDDSSPNEPHHPKIVDGTFFKLIEWDNEKDIVRAACMNCKSELKTQTSSTGNLHKHLRRMQKSIAEKAKIYCIGKESDSSQSSTQPAKQAKLTSFVNKLDREKVYYTSNLI